MLDQKATTYFENPRKLASIKTDDDFNLHLIFDNGEMRTYNMKEELEGIFAVLKDKNKFHSVFIDEFGNAAWDIDDTIDSSLQWGNRIDICKDALYMDSIPRK